MTKPELRTALKALAIRLDLATKYERSAIVTLSVVEIDRWRAAAARAV